MRLLFTLILCAHLLAPISAHAQQTLRNPLQISLAEYGLMLGAAIFGGVVGWIRKVKAGDLPPWSLAHLVGEMAISAFAGLLVFWACTAIGLQMVVIAPLAGMAGLLGSKGLALAERAAQRYAERRLGLQSESRL